MGIIHIHVSVEEGWKYGMGLKMCVHLGCWENLEIAGLTHRYLPGSVSQTVRARFRETIPFKGTCIRCLSGAKTYRWAVHDIRIQPLNANHLPPIIL